MKYVNEVFQENLIFSIFDNGPIDVDKRIEDEANKNKDTIAYILSSPLLHCNIKQYMIALQILSDSEMEVSGKPSNLSHAISSLSRHYETNPFGMHDDSQFKAEVGILAHLFRIIDKIEKFPEKYKSNLYQFGLWIGVESNNDSRVKQDVIRKRISAIENFVTTKYAPTAELVYKSF